MNSFRRTQLHVAVLTSLGINSDLSSFPYKTICAHPSRLITLLMQVPLESFPKVMFPLKRSQEVLDFNLFISPFAIWEGVITHIEVKEVLPEGSILAQEGDRGLGSAREGYIEISDLA